MLPPGFSGQIRGKIQVVTKGLKTRRFIPQKHLENQEVDLKQDNQSNRNIGPEVNQVFNLVFVN